MIVVGIQTVRPLECAMSKNTIPFAALDPDLILDAIEDIGLKTDGRLLALNSYENRVYQVGIEEAEPIVVKFYRPGRWSDEAIEEEVDVGFDRFLGDKFDRDCKRTKGPGSKIMALRRRLS